MNLQEIECADLRVKKMGYVVICGVMSQLIVSGKRIALSGELKSLKKLTDPLHVDVDEDSSLLRILEEPHVKIASVLVDYSQVDVLEPYALLNALDDDVVLEDQWATDMGWKLFWRYMFYREHPRVRDRYVNFTRVLLTAQRVLFELLKLMVTHQTRAFGSRYRTNYSAGRLRALMKGNEDKNALMICRFIHKLKDLEHESRALLLR